MIKNATVLGGGAFGTAMAAVLARNNINVTMWIREKEVVDQVNNTNENKMFLPKVKLDKKIKATDDFKTSLKSTELVLLVIPTQFLRQTMTKFRNDLPVNVPLVCCSKGIENNSYLTPYEILVEELPGKYHQKLAALSGPSFAKEVAIGLPTNVLCASIDIEVAEFVQQAMSDKVFRVYTGTDVMGAEICGAIKNVLAIACGGADGYGFGKNTAALLMTRGLLELSRLAIAKGAKASTMMGLAGMGDLVLTCTSSQSRNYTFGKRIAKGETVEEILASGVSIAEGYKTSLSVHTLSKILKVDMPICEEVYNVLHQQKPLDQALLSLQSRPLRREFTDTELELSTKSVGNNSKNSKL